jgi:hypothetical protein
MTVLNLYIYVSEQPYPRIKCINYAVRYNLDFAFGQAAVYPKTGRLVHPAGHSSLEARTMYYSHAIPVFIFPNHDKHGS